MPDLFSDQRPEAQWHGQDILHLPNAFDADASLRALKAVFDVSPLRHMKTPGGQQMSAAMTSAGALGWISDSQGYRYSPIDPLTGYAWPDIPPVLLATAQAAARRYGQAAFAPDACLINRYAPGARLTAHQDRDEQDVSIPVVSLSFGASARFRIGGQDRADPMETIILEHGDALVFGRSKRLAYHAVMPMKPGAHPVLGPDRIVCTFRVAG